MTDRKAYYKRYYAENKGALGLKAKEYYREHKEQLAEYSLAYRYAQKMDALDAYGGPRCACCGETLFEGLTIDHISGEGADHRRKIGDAVIGNTIYRWLKRNSYPPGFQVLCGTCNIAKRTSIRCPHEAQRSLFDYAPY
jgi:hypothetical protein